MSGSFDRQSELFAVVAPDDARLVDLDLVDASVAYQRAYLPLDDRAAIFDELLATIPWVQDEIVVFGRKVLVPRLSSWHGDPEAGYSYSNVVLDPKSWTPALLSLKHRIEQSLSTTFNSVLVNYYRDGRDGVAWHADDERELGPEPFIASLSLGAVRTFQLKHRTLDGVRHSMELHDGSLLVMGGRTQRCWLHQVPKTSTVVGARLNLTFRTVHPNGVAYA